MQPNTLTYKTGAKFIPRILEKIKQDPKQDPDSDTDQKPTEKQDPDPKKSFGHCSEGRRFQKKSQKQVTIEAQDSNNLILNFLQEIREGYLFVYKSKKKVHT